MASLVEDSLIKTSLIEQVVAPIAAHICYLTLLSETTDKTESFIQLEASAHAVAKASRNMAEVASRLMAGSDDDVMRLEMGPLLEPLMMSGQHVLLATQKLSIQPQISEHREELVEATQNVLLGVIKVLLVEDDATVRKITTASDRLLNRLRDVGNATDVPSLLKAFQAFSKAFLLLHSLVMGRVTDLRDHRQQDGLKTSVEILRKSISMLHTAMYTTIKHPTSEVAQDSKKYILQLLKSTINDIIMMLKGNYHRTSTRLCGYYTERRHRLLKLVSDPAIIPFKDSNFDVVLRDLVFHCMAVANSSKREIGSCLTANCKHVLQLWSEISQQIKQTNRHCSDKQEPKDHQEKLCVSLIKQIHELDEAVVKATLFQVIDAFVITSSPLEQLINTVHNLLEADLDNGLDLDPIQTLFETFRAYADRIAQVAGFVSALATDEKSLERVEHSVSGLLKLKDGVSPLLLELEGDSVQCHGALHKLISFQQKWRDETEQLLKAFCDVINVKDFIHLSVEEMKCDLEKCLEARKFQDHHLLNKHTRLLFGRMSQVVQLVRRCVDKSDDPIYRNGLLVLVKQAEMSAREVTQHATDLFDNNLQDEVFFLLANSITVAIKNFDVLHEGLDGLEHPHLLSPLREGARQTASTSPVSYIKEAKTTTNDQIKTEEVDHGDEKEDLAIKPKVTLTEKESPELTIVHQFKTTEAKKSFIMDSKSVKTSHSTDFLPLLSEVVNLSKAKNIEALNVACIQIMELSSCYTQATKEAASIVEQNDHQEMETLRSKLVTLTPLLVQAAQETAMSSVNIIDTVYKHSAQFSDLIKNINSILLPVTGLWFHGIKAMIRSHADMVDTCVQELTEVMCLCADTVELVASTDIRWRKGDDSIASILNKLQKAQTNTKKLTDLVVPKTGQDDELDGPCILWALSIQVLLSSLDRILGTQGRGTHQMTPKKWLAAMSEYSLRIQEAARLSSINCRDSSKAKLLKERDEVKALSALYLQATDDLGTVSISSVLRLARTELLQRQLQIKMKSLCCLLSKVNEEYVTAIQSIVSLACSATIKDCTMDTDVHEIHTQFDATADSFLKTVKTAAESVQDCLNFMRDPRERSSLRFISDHLSFQMSEIVSRARVIMATQTISETLSIDIQTQCWSAKAHYLVEELYKVEGIFPATKEMIKLGLQGKAYSGGLQTDKDSSAITTHTKPPRQVISEKTNPGTIPLMNNQESKTESARMPVLISLDPTLTYTSLFLKREAERWDVCGNQIVSATKEMADKIYDMTQYLKRKGPIQNKDAFVSSATNLVLDCQTITQFLKVIADHCLDLHSAKELCIILEQISTITNQLTIISSVNAVTPACKSSDEILVKNAQNLLQTIIQGVRAAETACIKGLRQPEPNSEAADAAYLCIQWKKNLLIHRTQEKLNPDTDDLGLRKTSLQPATPSLAPPISVLKKI